MRQPADAAEQALVRQGWMPYGPVAGGGMTRIVLALSGFDGMCRPIGYQAFVYWEGRYAGTLSPVPMDSRADGALSDIRVESEANVSADFVRYTQSDPLCCPSRVATVTYSLRRDDVPTLLAERVVHTPAKR